MIKEWTTERQDPAVSKRFVNYACRTRRPETSPERFRGLFLSLSGNALEFRLRHFSAHQGLRSSSKCIPITRASPRFIVSTVANKLLSDRSCMLSAFRCFAIIEAFHLVAIQFQHRSDYNEDLGDQESRIQYQPCARRLKQEYQAKILMMKVSPAIHSSPRHPSPDSGFRQAHTGNHPWRGNLTLGMR